MKWFLFGQKIDYVVIAQKYDLMLPLIHAAGILKVCVKNVQLYCNTGSF